MTEPHAENVVIVRADAGDDAAGIALHGRACEAREHPTDPADADSRGYSAGNDGAKCREPRAGDDDLSLSSPPELIPIPPRRELRPQRLADPYELCTVTKSSEPDLVRRGAEARAAVQTLCVLDRLPSLFERREVPPFAGWAYDPKPSLRRVERETAANGKVLDRLVRPERTIAEETRSVHGPSDLALLIDVCRTRRQIES